MHCVLFCCLKLLRFCFNILQIDVLIFVKQQQFFFTYISCFCIIIIINYNLRLFRIYYYKPVL